MGQIVLICSLTNPRFTPATLQSLTQLANQQKTKNKKKRKKKKYLEEVSRNRGYPELEHNCRQPRANFFIVMLKLGWATGR
jgi:hypothetical protein